MPDPEDRDEITRQQSNDDHFSHRDPPRPRRRVELRHYRGMLPGGRMYGEDDSVVGYFAGHAWRGIKALHRVVTGASRKQSRSSSDLRDSIEYKDYDPD